MNNDTNAFENQICAVRGFSNWLTSTLHKQSIESQDFSSGLLSVLQFYEWELERQIEGTPALQDWYHLVALGSMMGLVLKDELLENNPGLSTYRPADQPKTVDQMTAKLLSDAIAQFETSQNEMAAYLAKPEFPGLLNGFLQSIMT